MQEQKKYNILVKYACHPSQMLNFYKFPTFEIIMALISNYEIIKARV